MRKLVLFVGLMFAFAVFAASSAAAETYGGSYHHFTGLKHKSHKYHDYDKYKYHDYDRYDYDCKYDCDDDDYDDHNDHDDHHYDDHDKDHHDYHHYYDYKDYSNGHSYGGHYYNKYEATRKHNFYESVVKNHHTISSKFDPHRNKKWVRDRTRNGKGCDWNGYGHYCLSSYGYKLSHY